MPRPGTIVQPWKTVPSEQLEREERQRQRREERRQQEETAKAVEEFIPKPLPTTEGFTVKADWDVAETDAQDKPSVYVDSAGVRYYAPGNPMWQMGYRNSLEYRGYRQAFIDPETGQRKVVTVGGGAVSDRPKSKAPWIALVDIHGKSVHISKDNLRKISKLSDENQIKEFQRLEILPAPEVLLSARPGRAKIELRMKQALSGVVSTRKALKLIGILKAEKQPSYHEAVRIPVSGAVSQERYLKELDHFNQDVKQFNKDVKNLDEYVDWLEVQADRLQPKLDFLANQNKMVAKLEAEADRLNALAASVNPLVEKQVTAYNNKLAAFNAKLAGFKVPEAKIQGIIKDINQYNNLVSALNLKYDKLKVPTEPKAPKEDLGSFVVKAWHGTKQSFRDATAKHLKTSEKVKNVSSLVADMIVPGLWARHWNQLGWGERNFNIAMDIVILIPLIKLGSIGLRAATKQVGKATIKQFLKLERAHTNFIVSKLKPRYGKAVANQFKLISATQGKYLLQLIKLDKLRIKKAGARRIGAQEKAVRQTKIDLEHQARQFVDEIKAQKGGRVPHGWAFDDPRLADVFNRLPRDIITHTENIARSLVPKKGNLKALRADMMAAEKRLLDAQAKWTDPTKLTDIVDDLMVKQVRYNQAMMGSIQEIQKEMLRLKSILDRGGISKAQLKIEISKVKGVIIKLQSELTKKPWLTSQQKGIIRNKIKNLKLKLINLSQTKPTRLTPKQRLTLKARWEELGMKLDQAIKRLEVEYGRGGALTRGRTATDVQTRLPKGPTKITGQLKGGGLGVSTKAATGTATAILAKAITQADLKLVMGTVTDPAVRDAIATETIRAIKSATDLHLKGMTKIEIEARIRESLRESLKPHLRPATKTAPKTRAKLITKTALKVATATKVPTKLPPIRPKLFPRIFRGASPEQIREIIKQAKGAYAWRQGQFKGQDVWHGRIYPYRKKDKFSLLGEPPKGAKIVATGKGSAHKTATVLYGQPPVKPKIRDMGMMVVHITPTKNRQNIKLTFKKKRQIDLGAGIVQEGSRRHIKLV